MLASYPDHVRGGKSGLVSTVCACAKTPHDFMEYRIPSFTNHLMLLMVVTMILKYLIFSHLSSSHFSTLTLIHNPEPIFNTILRNLLTPLPSLLFLSPRRPFVMLSLNLNTAKMMAQSSPPITSSMLKMFSVFLFLSCSLQ